MIVAMSSKAETVAATDGDPPKAGEKGEKGRREPGFEMKKWSPVFMWKWEVSSDICSICRSDINGACVECQANHREKCEPAWGSCGVCFLHLLSHLFCFFCVVCSSFHPLFLFCFE